MKIVNKIIEFNKSTLYRYTIYYNCRENFSFKKRYKLVTSIKGMNFI